MLVEESRHHLLKPFGLYLKATLKGPKAVGNRPHVKRFNYRTNGKKKAAQLSGASCM